MCYKTGEDGLGLGRSQVGPQPNWVRAGATWQLWGVLEAMWLLHIFMSLSLLIIFSLSEEEEEGEEEGEEERKGEEGKEIIHPHCTAS